MGKKSKIDRDRLRSEENSRAFLLLKDAVFVRHKIRGERGVGKITGIYSNPHGTYQQIVVDWGNGLSVPESPELLEKLS